MSQHDLRPSQPDEPVGPPECGPTSLDSDLFPARERRPFDAHAPPNTTAEAELPRWLTVDQIRKMQRMRRERVVEAMLSGELPYEQRGRIRYARLPDVLAWEERRLAPEEEPLAGLVHPDLADWA